MKAAPILAALLFASGAVISPAAEEASPRTNMKEALKARMAADAKKAPVAPAPKGGPTPAPAAAPGTPAEAEPAAGTDVAQAEKAPPAKTDPTMLPKVEVKKGKYSERDRQLALDLHKQEQDIARERKNLTVSETDLALNSSKIAKPLAIFGGDSAQFRQRVAAERVELMEAEKDIIEAIAIAQKPEEKKELQKQLDELRAMRRQLDKSLR